MALFDPLNIADVIFNIISDAYVKTKRQKRSETPRVLNYLLITYVLFHINSNLILRIYLNWILFVISHLFFPVYPGCGFSNCLQKKMP